MPTKQEVAPLSEAELRFIEQEPWYDLSPSVGPNGTIQRLLATVRALQHNIKELEIRMAALDPNHTRRGAQVPNPAACGEQAVERAE